VEEYVQNEEQSPTETLMEQVKELDIAEPDKNEIILPDLPNTMEEIPDIAESITVEKSINQGHKFETYKKRLPVRRTITRELKQGSMI
jgi:hypothetical protein